LFGSDIADAPSSEIEAAVQQLAAVVDDLSSEELVALTQTLNVSPPAVKQAFEQEINVFSGKFDGYVPLGSTITVGQRRAVGAAVVAGFVVPAATVGSRRRM
jgi:hypothetical protein